MDDLFRFLASMNGRITRAVVGIVLIIIGLLALGGTAGIIVAIIGLVPLLAGLLDFCVFAPLFGHAFQGQALRDELKK